MTELEGLKIFEMETGHAKNVANLGKAKINITGYGANYQPSNPRLAISAIGSKYTNSDVAVKAVEPFRVPYKNFIDGRKVIFAGVNKLFTSAFKNLKSSDGVPKTTVNDAFTILKKIKGTNKPPKLKEGEPVPGAHSTSQQSYDMRLANVNELIALLANTTQYNPTETDIQVLALKAFAEDLQKANDKVAETYQPFSEALKNRDIELYYPETGLYDIAAKLKLYVSSITALSATDKKLITSLKFTKPSKKFLHF